MKIKRRYIVLLIILLIVGGIGYWIYRSATTPPQVEVVSVKPKTLEIQLASTGKVQPKERVNLGFLNSGKVSNIVVSVGDQVKKGQVLGYVSREDLYQQEVKAQADYRGVLEELREFEFQNKDKPRDERYNFARWQLNASIDSIKALYDYAIANRRNNALISPINGTVIEKNAEPGEISGSTENALIIADLKELEFEAEVDEQDVGSISEGLAGKVLLDAFPGKEFDASIRLVEPFARTNNSGATFFRVKVSFFHGDNVVRAGMNGEVDLVTQRVEAPLTLSLDGLVEDGDEKSVWVVKNSQVEKRNVRTGLMTDTDVEIIEGLTPEDQVVINPPVTLREKTAVTVKGTK